MNKKILKINSYILIIPSTILMLFFIIYTAYSISIPSTSNSWDDLGKVILGIVTIIVYTLSLPSVISGISTLHYLKGKKTCKLCTFFNVIGIILYSLFIFLFVYIDILNVFKDYYNGNIYTGFKIIFSMIAFFLFVCPLIINIIGLYKEKNNLNHKVIWHRYRFIVIGIIVIMLIIIFYNLFKFNINKIEISEDNIYTCSDFKSELESRNLSPNNKSTSIIQQGITALDSSSKYGYTFSSSSYTDSYRLSVNTSRKFPMFVYDSYTSLIKKNNKTADYNYIEPEDWYINWYIYYVNGEIYAAIGDESEYGSSWKTSLSTTKYGVVVSEKEDITIYNSKNNYFMKGGGILNTCSGTQRNSFPTTTDTYNENCIKIKVVDKVNAETLDKIAKELSPQYWNVYKSNN